METDKSREVEPISGWLSLFLWIGIGVGAICSCIITFGEIAGYGFSPVFVILSIGTLLPLCMIAFLTIKSFYRQETNAVSLAKTYIAMIAIDGIFQILIGVIVGDSSGALGIVRSFGWSFVWFAYLVTSSKVENRIPSETRDWKKTEKVLLGIYVGCYVFLAFGVKILVMSPAHDMLISREALIESSIKEANKELPTLLDDGFVFKKMEIEGSTISFIYKYTETSVMEMDLQHINEIRISGKQQLLESYATETDLDSKKLCELYFSNRYNICYKYIDKEEVIIYKTTICPNEYEQAIKLGSDFRCDRSEWDAILRLRNSRLPLPMFVDCEQESVCIDFSKNYLLFKIIMLDVDSDVLQQLTNNYLKEFVKENIPTFINDPLVSMAIIDKLDLHFLFLTSARKTWTEVEIPYSIYSTYLAQ